MRRQRHDFFHVLDIKIRDAPMADQPVRLEFFHRLNCFVQWDMPPPVKQVEIEVIRPQALKRGTAMAMCPFQRRMIRRDLTDEKRILPPHRHDVSNQRFRPPITVDLGGIDHGQTCIQPLMKAGDLLTYTSLWSHLGTMCPYRAAQRARRHVSSSRLLQRVNSGRARRQRRGCGEGKPEAGGAGPSR